MSHTTRPFVLLICDGWGENPDAFGNAIRAAHTPAINEIMKTWPHTTVTASGEAVGLPEGQQGNSEVGHLTIGSGRVIRQPLTRQHHEIETGIFDQNEVLIAAIELAKERNTSLHVLGLISPGGVHSHTNGAIALAKLAKKLGLSRVHIHAFTDGRDTVPKLALEHLQEFETELANIGVGKIASISGRYYAMDRDNRWERIELAYDALVANAHATTPSTADYITKSYAQGDTDEFLKPISIAATSEDRARIQDGDVVVFFNFRPDRARQLSHALVDESFDGFKRSTVLHDIHFVSFTEYDETLQVPVAFPNQNAANSLAEVISNHGLKQYHVAETEKYAHVTYFLNGGREEAFPGETREMIASPKVATYDLEPAMSALAVTDAIIAQLKTNTADFIVANYANADMVGHTGNFIATKEAIEILDGCIGRLVEAVLAKEGVILITADHGNAEYKINPETNEALSAHTTNPVPVILCGTLTKKLRDNGSLSDIAPTVLAAMNIETPKDMTGTSLIIA